MVCRWLQSLKQQERKLMNKVKCVQPCFSMYICAIQAQMETRSPLVHPGTEKAIGVDLLVSPIDRLPPRYSPDGGSPVDICLGLCLVRSQGHYKPCLCPSCHKILPPFHRKRGVHPNN